VGLPACLRACLWASSSRPPQQHAVLLKHRLVNQPPVLAV
jgi:hypothetical protein